MYLLLSLIKETVGSTKINVF